MNKIFLRPWHRDDAAALAVIANNVHIWNNVRDNLPLPYTINDAKSWIQFCKAQNPIVNFAIIYEGAVAGSIGCVLQKDVYRKNVEIGYFLDEKLWGHGIATEAVKILLSYIEINLDAIRIYAEVFAHNKASMKVLQKNGFVLESIRRNAAIKNNIISDDYVWVKLLPY